MTREALPTIRRTGAHLDPRRVDTTDPEAVAKTAWEAAQTARELFVEERAKRWEIGRPVSRTDRKALVANELFGSSGLLGLPETTRAFGMRQSDFPGLLRQWGRTDLGAKAHATELGYLTNKVFLTAGSRTVSGTLTRKGISRLARKLVDTERTLRTTEQEVSTHTREQLRPVDTEHRIVHN